MSAEQKIQKLLRAACRMEREGDLHVAEVLRKMAAESLPAGGIQTLPSIECSED
jgi:hypothetical protein